MLKAEVLFSILSIYTLTLVVSSYDGPYNILLKLRDKWSPYVLRDLLSCFVCLSVWMSIPFAVALSGGLYEFVLHWFGMTGAAIILHRITDR